MYKSERLVKELETIKKILEKSAGKGKVNNNLKTPYEIAVVEQLMLKEGRAYALEKKLTNYVKYIHKEYEHFDIPKFPKIIINNQKIAFFENRPLKKQQNFVQAYFSNTPVIVAILHITYFQAMIIRYRDEVINYMVLRLLDPK
ncbi:hypothetical protein M23134_06717 [Microscilla marina ATCC 23134]|uniref:Gliding motility-associated protein GldM N-terminal domain-containing protein n=2 Tax=Microscilla marina TaxID=1027 RepID=A1ZXP7_MICM2|nr:hypothetical protein M23134_06717 [Microscilla marina ATCC 23134]